MVCSKRFGLVAVLLCLQAGAIAQRLSPLAPAPNWKDLEAYQETITRDEFTHLLDAVYAPNGAAAAFIDLGTDRARIKTQVEPPMDWTLRFAPDDAHAKPPPRFWRPARALSPDPEGKPMAGVRVAIDPGHLGGSWARMEERYLEIGAGPPITEGDMTLRVARLLAPMLEALGAKVDLVRKEPGPVTRERPDDLLGAARGELARDGIAQPKATYSGPDDPARRSTLQAESEILFYRTSEIRARARIVNEDLKPDITVCLHFNAEPWGDPKHAILSAANHLHVILNGCYSAAELRKDDVRFDMLLKLLNRSYSEELGASECVAKSMAAATGLPPYTYTTSNAIHVGGNPYLWARNLLANRLYRTPVVFIEPYVMNSQNVADRVAAGDYDGEREVAGAMRKSIYREYADGVADGLRAWYGARGSTHAPE